MVAQALRPRVAEGHQRVVAVDDLQSLTGADPHRLGDVKLVAFAARQQKAVHHAEDLRARGKLFAVALGLRDQGADPLRLVPPELALTVVGAGEVGLEFRIDPVDRLVIDDLAVDNGAVLLQDRHRLVGRRMPVDGTHCVHGCLSLFGWTILARNICHGHGLLDRRSRARGGFRQSGYGNDMAHHAPERFCKYKNTWIELSG